jgi:TonB family protein
MLRSLLSVIVMGATCHAALAQQQSALPLLEAALAKSNIFEQGPFLLVAHYRTTDDPKFQGQYALLWVSEQQWREEILDPTGNFIRIGKDNLVWSMRTSPKPTALAQDLRWLFGFRSRLSPRPEVVVEKVKSEKVNGNSVQCAHLKDAMTKDKACVDAANRLLSTKEEEYSDYRQVGRAYFPFRLGSKRFQREVQVTVDKIDSNPQIRSELFAVDQRFQSAPGCYAPQYPLTLKKLPPTYPSTAKAARIQGRVTAEVSLTEAGTVADVELIHGHPMLAPETLRTLKTWTFAPARCDGAPVSSKMIVEVTFTLSSGPPLPARF